MSETRKIAAILVSDDVGYCRLAGADVLDDLRSHKGNDGRQADPMKDRYPSSYRLIALTSIPSSSFSSASINSREKPSVHKHLGSMRITPNLKRRLSEFTNKGSARAIAGAKAHFRRYHVNRVPAVF